MFSNIIPQKSGVKKRIIKKFQSCRSRKWERRWVLHPGSGEPAAMRQDDLMIRSRKQRAPAINSQQSDNSVLEELDRCGSKIDPQKFMRISNDPVWIKRWVSKDNFNPKKTDISCSATDQLTQDELTLLRRLQSQEVSEYGRGFYQSDFFDAIMINYNCQHCGKDMHDLPSLRTHIAQKHPNASNVQKSYPTSYSTLSMAPMAAGTLIKSIY